MVIGAGIEAIFLQSKRRYGAPRIHAELKDRDFRISKRTVARLMQEQGLRPPRGRRRVPITTDSRHSHTIAPNQLARNFDVAIPDTVWLADISYIPTEGHVHPHLVIGDMATWQATDPTARL